MSRTSRGASRSLPRLLASALAVVLAVVTGSCDKVPLFAPTNSTITLTLNRTTLPLNGTAAVTATVIRSAGHSVQNGTLVTFVSNLGTFDPAEVETEGGRATTTFIAGTQSGTALLSATSGGNRSDEVQVLVGAAAAERVVVRAEPTSVPVTGGTVQITAVVTDLSGNPLPGAQVIFTSDGGTLSSSSGLTDASGEARVSLTTNRETIVRANVAGKEGTATVRATSLPQVTITGPTTPVTVGNPASFTLSTPAPPGGTTGNPIVSITVDFGDGQVRQVSPGTTSVTNVYHHPGTFVVTARATDSAGLTGSSSTSVVVLERAGIPITLTASPNPATQGAIVTFTVGNPPANAISYTWDLGDGTGRVTTGPSTQHTYLASAALRTISVTVRTTEGGTGTATALLRVNP